MKREIRGFLLGIIAVWVFTVSVGNAQELRKIIEVSFNSIGLMVNGEKVGADNIVYEGTTYVPLREIATMFGKEVDWNSETKTVAINDIVEENDLLPDFEPSFMELKFYESDSSGMLDEIEYRTSFEKNQTRYVYFELFLEQKSKPQERIHLPLKIFYYDATGNIVAKMFEDFYIEKGWEASTHFMGYGSDAGGTWDAGEYTVRIFYGNKLLISNTFSVVD